MVTFKKLEAVGGVASILAAFGCVAIGWMDYTTGQSWHIWAIMFGVLLLNGILMLISASRRNDHPIAMPGRRSSLGVRNHI